jgi:hypothetical protein
MHWTHTLDNVPAVRVATGDVGHDPAASLTVRDQRCPGWWGRRPVYVWVTELIFAGLGLGLSSGTFRVSRRSRRSLNRHHSEHRYSAVPGQVKLEIVAGLTAPRMLPLGEASTAGYLRFVGTSRGMKVGLRRPPDTAKPMIPKPFGAVAPP